MCTLPLLYLTSTFFFYSIIEGDEINFVSLTLVSFSQGHFHSLCFSFNSLHFRSYKYFRKCILILLMKPGCNWPNHLKSMLCSERSIKRESTLNYFHVFRSNDLKCQCSLENSSTRHVVLMYVRNVTVKITILVYGELPFKN